MFIRFVASDVKSNNEKPRDTLQQRIQKRPERDALHTNDGLDRYVDLVW